MDGNEEGCGFVCGTMFDMSTSEGGTPTTGGASTTFTGSGMEMGARDNGFCDGFAKVIKGARHYLGYCGSFDKDSSFLGHTYDGLR